VRPAVMADKHEELIGDEDEEYEEEFEEYEEEYEDDELADELADAGMTTACRVCSCSHCTCNARTCCFSQNASLLDSGSTPALQHGHIKPGWQQQIRCCCQQEHSCMK